MGVLRREPHYRLASIHFPAVGLIEGDARGDGQVLGRKRQGQEYRGKHEPLDHQNSTPIIRLIWSAVGLPESI